MCSSNLLPTYLSRFHLKGTDMMRSSVQLATLLCIAGKCLVQSAIEIAMIGTESSDNDPSSVGFDQSRVIRNWARRAPVMAVTCRRLGLLIQQRTSAAGQRGWLGGLSRYLKLNVHKTLVGATPGLGSACPRVADLPAAADVPHWWPCAKPPSFLCSSRCTSACKDGGSKSARLFPGRGCGALY